MATYWCPVCQWCGKTGSRTSSSTDFPPNGSPNISGKCPSHPSGNKDAVHGPKWEQRG